MIETHWSTQRRALMTRDGDYLRGKKQIKRQDSSKKTSPVVSGRQPSVCRQGRFH